MFEEKVARILLNRCLTLSIAESCTGGLLSHRLTNIPGSSKFLKGSLIVYSNESKNKLLKVPLSLLSQKGAVSEPVALTMAQNVKKLFKSDIGLSITGIAGPTGGSREKPIGLVFLALSYRNESLALKCLFKGKRIEIKKQASTQALQLISEFFN